MLYKPSVIFRSRDTKFYFINWLSIYLKRLTIKIIFIGDCKIFLQRVCQVSFIERKHGFSNISNLSVSPCIASSCKDALLIIMQKRMLLDWGGGGEVISVHTQHKSCIVEEWPKINNQKDNHHIKQWLNHTSMRNKAQSIYLEYSLKTEESLMSLST